MLENCGILGEIKTLNSSEFPGKFLEEFPGKIPEEFPETTSRQLQTTSRKISRKKPTFGNFFTKIPTKNSLK